MYHSRLDHSIAIDFLHGILGNEQANSTLDDAADDSREAKPTSAGRERLEFGGVYPYHAGFSVTPTANNNSLFLAFMNYLFFAGNKINISPNKDIESKQILQTLYDFSLSFKNYEFERPENTGFLNFDLFLDREKLLDGENKIHQFKI